MIKNTCHNLLVRLISLVVALWFISISMPVYSLQPKLITQTDNEKNAITDKDKAAFLKLVETYKDDLNMLSVETLRESGKDIRTLYQRLLWRFKSQGGYSYVFTIWEDEIKEIVGRPVSYRDDVMIRKQDIKKTPFENIEQVPKIENDAIQKVADEIGAVEKHIARREKESAKPEAPIVDRPISYEDDVLVRKKYNPEENKIAFLNLVETYKDDLNKLSSGSLRNAEKDVCNLYIRINESFKSQGGYPYAFTIWKDEISKIVGRPVSYNDDILVKKHKSKKTSIEDITQEPKDEMVKSQIPLDLEKAKKQAEEIFDTLLSLEMLDDETLDFFDRILKAENITEEDVKRLEQLSKTCADEIKKRQEIDSEIEAVEKHIARREKNDDEKEEIPDKQPRGIKVQTVLEQLRLKWAILATTSLRKYAQTLEASGIPEIMRNDILSNEGLTWHAQKMGILRFMQLIKEYDIFKNFDVIKTLDIGSGPSVFTLALLDVLDTDSTSRFSVTDVDISEEQLKVGQELQTLLYPHRPFNKSVCCAVPPIPADDNSVDLINMSNVLNQLQDPNLIYKFLLDSNRVLKDDGIIFIISSSQSIKETFWLECENLGFLPILVPSAGDWIDILLLQKVSQPSQSITISNFSVIKPMAKNAATRKLQKVGEEISHEKHRDEDRPKKDFSKLTADIGVVPSTEAPVLEPLWNELLNVRESVRFSDPNSKFISRLKAIINGEESTDVVLEKIYSGIYNMTSTEKIEYIKQILSDIDIFLKFIEDHYGHNMDEGLRATGIRKMQMARLKEKLMDMADIYETANTFSSATNDAKITAEEQGALVTCQ